MQERFGAYVYRKVFEYQPKLPTLPAVVDASAIWLFCYCAHPSYLYLILLIFDHANVIKEKKKLRATAVAITSYLLYELNYCNQSP